jgi:hypothetical protein
MRSCGLARKSALAKANIVTNGTDDRCITVGFIGALLRVIGIADRKIQ